MLALVMVFVVGVIAASVLSLSDTSLRATTAVKSDRRSLYAADGAVETAIQRIRKSPDSANLGYNDGQSCALDVPATGSQPAVHVDCPTTDGSFHQNKSGDPGDGGTGSTNPGAAILTLGRRANTPGRASDGFWLFGGSQYAYNWRDAPSWWNIFADHHPPWGNIIEPGLMFQASKEKGGSSGANGNGGDVVVQGPIFDNSTIATYSQFNVVDQADPVSGKQGIAVRQTCGTSGGGSITGDVGTAPYNGCNSPLGYGNGTEAYGRDPKFPHRGQLQGAAPIPSTPVAVPSSCGSSTLMTLNPGLYTDAQALNALFQNSSCNGKDFWFTPGIYYFDFRNTSTPTAFCNRSGANYSSALTDAAHEWCIRSSTGGVANRIHIVGGTPQGLNWADLAPVANLLQASVASSTDFAPAANAADGINATVATTTWSSNSANQNPSAATSSQVGTQGVDDFVNKNNATGAIDATISSASLASASAATTASAIASTQLVPGNDDFANKANGRTIDGPSSATTLASTSTPQGPTNAASSSVSGAADFAPLANATDGINGSVASHTLTSTVPSITPGQAVSTQVGAAGIDDFNNPGNGRLIDGTATSSALAGMSQVQTATAAVSSTVTGPSDFAYLNNTIGIDGASATHTLASGSASMVPATADSSQTVTGTDDFANKANGKVIDGATTSATISATGSATLKPAGNAASGSSFSPSGNALAIDGSFASYTSTCSFFLCQSGQITLQGYPDIPASVAPTGATITVKHYENSTSSIGTLKVDVLDGSGTTLCTVSPPASTSSANSYSVTLPAACLNTAAKVNGVQLRFTGAMSTSFSGSRTFNLDGIELAITYAGAAPRTLTLGSLSPQIPDAANATLDTAVLTIKHAESAAANQQIVITPGGGGAACAAVALPQQAAPANDTINVKASGCLDSAVKLNGATIVYQASTASGTVTSTVDGVKIDATYTNTATRSVTLSSPSPAIAASASIDSAVLSVAHQETGSNANPRLVITPGGGGGACATIPLTPRAPLATDTIDVKASGCLNTPVKLNGATVQYAVNLTDNGAAQSAPVALDGVTVTVGSTDTTNRAVTLSSFSPAVPTTGSTTLDSAVLSVAHQETGANVNPRLMITPGGGGSCASVALTPHATLTTDTIDVKASGCLNTPAKINGATVQYVVNLSATGSAQSAIATLDGVKIDVNATDSAVRTLTLSNPLPAVPTAAGTTLDTAVLSIAHRETGTNVNPRLVITPGGGGGACAAIPLTPRATLTTDTVDVKGSGCLNAVTKLNGATFVYQVNLTDNGGAQSATVSVDGLRVDVVTTNTTNRGLTLSSWAPALSGAIDSAVLSVAHQETGAAVNPRLVITPGGGGGACASVALAPRASLTTDTVDVKASGCLNTATRLNGATVQYLVNLTDNGAVQSGTAALDGMRIDVGSTDTATRTLTLSNASPALTGGAGNVVDAANLSIAHRETGANSNPRLVITPNGSGACAPIALTPRTALTTDTVDVTPCLNTVGRVNGATYAYLVNLTASGGAQSAVASVDGVNLSFGATDTSNRQITLSGFGPAIPGSVSLTGVTVAVAHTETAGTNPRIVVTAGGGGTQTYALPVHAGGLSSDTVDVSGLLDTPAKVNGATVQFLVNVTGGPVSATASLDGASIGATYTPAPDRVPDLPVTACDENQPGVEWVFGGDSRVYMPDAQAQLCAGPPPTGSKAADGTAYNQHVVVYGMPALDTMRPSTVVGNPGGYTNSAGAYVIGDTPLSTADANTVWIFKPSAAITLGGFNNPLPADMSNLVIDKVYARISHGEDPFAIFSAPDVKFTNGLGQSCGTQSLTVNGWLNTGTWVGPGGAYNTVDLTSCFNTVAKLGGAGGSASAIQVTYTAYNDILPVMNDHLDGIELDVSLKPAATNSPVVAPEKGCITAMPNYWDGFSSPDCAVWKWDSVGPGGNDQKAQVAFSGTFYAPSAAIDIDDQGPRCTTADGSACLSGYHNGVATTCTNNQYCYKGVDYTLFSRGLIVRHVRFKAFMKKPGTTPPLITCGGSCGGIVPNPRVVELVANVCPEGAASCATGRKRIVAQVCFGPVSSGTCQVGTLADPPKIMKWSVQ
ncbi:MAG: hypothetical protein U0V73_03955 [Acidimicrobiia bacterium]